MVSLSRYAEERVQINPSIEVGCGVTPMKDNFPDILSSDIEPSPYADKQIDALSMPYLNDSLDSIFAINCFHHFSDKKLFLKESNRVLSNKGTLILLEPSVSFLARLTYPFLFKNETYDLNASLSSLYTSDPMRGANQAASFICFIKSKEEFLFKSGFHIEKIEHCKNSLAYIFSGGLNFPQLLPSRIVRLLIKLPLPDSLFSLHWIIKLRKTNLI